MAQYTFNDISVNIPDDLDLQVAKMPELKTLAVDEAKEVAAAARAAAPVDTGNYAAGIVVQETKFGAIVLATDQKSGWIEFGIPSRGIPARFILRRAVEAVGLKFRKRR